MQCVPLQHFTPDIAVYMSLWLCKGIISWKAHFHLVCYINTPLSLSLSLSLGSSCRKKESSEQTSARRSWTLRVIRTQRAEEKTTFICSSFKDSLVWIKHTWMFHTIMEKWDLKLWRQTPQRISAIFAVDFFLVLWCKYIWRQAETLLKLSCAKWKWNETLSLHFRGLYIYIFINSFLLNKGMSKVNCLSGYQFSASLKANMFTEFMCTLKTLWKNMDDQTVSTGQFSWP